MEGSGRNRKVGRQAIPACSVQECDSIGFRYLSIPDTRQHFSNRYQTSFVLQPLPPLIKRISPIERTPRPRERARRTRESLHGVGGSSTERMNRARSSRDVEYVIRLDMRSILHLDAKQASFDKFSKVSFF